MSQEDVEILRPIYGALAPGSTGHVYPGDLPAFEAAIGAPNAGTLNDETRAVLSMFPRDAARHL